MSRRPVTVIITLATLVGLLAAPASVVTAQRPAVNSPPNTLEFGIDAGAQFGLGDVSTVQITLPAARARVGFFLNNDSRWSIEPAAFLSYSKAEGGDGVFVYDLEVGALYHFRTPSAVTAVVPASVTYVRPFIAVTGFTGDNSDSTFSAGAGLRVKIPWWSALSPPLQASTARGFDEQARRSRPSAGRSLLSA